MSIFQTTYARIRRNWNAYWFSKESVTGLALFRIVFGILVLVFHLTSFFNFRFPELFSEAGFLWTRQPASWLPFVPSISFSSAYMLALLLLVATVMVIIGFKTRYAAGVAFIIHTYLVLAENVYNDNITSTVSVYFFLLMFSHAGKFLSLDAWLRHRSWIPKPTPSAPATIRKLMIWQLAIMYISNAMMKVAHGFSDWASGNLMIRALQDPTWASWWAWSVVSNFEGPFRLMTQIGFFAFLFLGIGLLFRKTRPIAAVFGLSWHWVSLLLTRIPSVWLIWVSPYILLVEPKIWDRYLTSLRSGKISRKAFIIGGLFFGLLLATMIF